MHRSRIVLSTLTACGLVVGVGLAAGSSTASASGPSVTVIASHLNNPRGLSADGGQVYVAESGRGGSNCAGGNCAGLTGSIDRVNAGGVTPRLRPDLGRPAPAASRARGRSAVSASAAWSWGEFGGQHGGDPAQSVFPSSCSRPRTETSASSSRIGGSFVAKAGVGDYDFIWTSGTQTRTRSSPTPTPTACWSPTASGTSPTPARTRWTRSMPNGQDPGARRTSPCPKGSPTDAVPTCVAKGPDGALYVGELLGGNFAPGGARVWRVVVKDGQATKPCGHAASPPSRAAASTAGQLLRHRVPGQRAERGPDREPARRRGEDQPRTATEP